MADIKLIHGDCVEKMKDLEDNSVDMVMTSPPYDNLRDYGKDFTGWGEHIWKPCLEQIFRVLKEGGVCVWVVGDATINGSETGTSFRQALYWMEIGGKLHDTMIYEKNSSTYPARKSSNRYTQIFEYMFVLSKGKPKASLLCDKKNKWAGHKDFSGKLKNPVPQYSPRHNIWRYVTSFSNKTGHPAPFPLQLAIDHILSWSAENDVILDPFMGSGTTGVACVNANRDFIGVELDEGYFKIAENRIQEYQPQGRLF